MICNNDLTAIVVFRAGHQNFIKLTEVVQA